MMDAESVDLVERHDNESWADIEIFKGRYQASTLGRIRSVAMIDTKTDETICVYESARIANEETGISYKGISSVCNGRAKTAGGYFWKFI